MSGWVEIAEQFADLFEAAGCGIWLLEGGRFSRLVTTNLPDEHWTRYGAYYGALDPWADLAAHRPGTPLLGQQLIAPRELEKSEFYQDFAAEFGIFHVAGALFRIDATMSGVISLQRPRKSPCFDVSERNLLSRLLPHVVRAQQLDQRFRTLERRAELGFAALNAMPYGTVAVGPDCQIHFANAKAEQFAGMSLGLKFSRNGLSAHSPTDDRQLRHFVATACKGEAGGTIALTQPFGVERRLVLTVAPLARSVTCVELHGALALVLIRDLKEEESLPGEMLRRLFRLTKAEQCVALALARGDDPGDIARERGVHISTVRTQVRQMIEKTGARSLRDLVRVIASLSQIK